MKHYLKTDSAGVVWGYTASDFSPGEDWVEVDFDATGSATGPTKMRLVNGALVDTGQPQLPPETWLTWDTAAMQWVDPRDLAAHKAAKWEEIKGARSEAEYAGFVWDGSPFDSDPLSQQKIIGASQWAGLNPAFVIDWTLADNTVRSLNSQQMQQVGQALGVHVNTVYDKGRTLRQQIESATTIPEVDAIHW